MRRKRLRNQTIDYHDLSPRAWNGTVAHLVQKDYSGGGGAAKEVCPSSSSGAAAANHSDSEQQGSSSDGEEGLGQGLGIILDKLKNIETKLDEIKELEEQNICVATIGHAAAADDVSKVPGILPEVGVTPTCSESSLQLLTHLTSDQQDRDPGQKYAQPKSDAGFLVDRACNTSLNRDAADTEPSVASSVDDVTLMADNDTDFEDTSNSENLTGKQRTIIGDDRSIVDDDGSKGVVISSPTASPAQPAAAALPSNLEIASVRSMSEEEGEGSDFCTEEARERRIEQLAQQIIDEKKKLEKLEEIEAKQRTEQIRITGSVDGNIAANKVAKFFTMIYCLITSQRLWRPCRSVRRTTRRRQRPQRFRSSSPARRAPVPGARAAPAATAPWPRFTTAGGATRPATRPSTARRSCTRAAGVPAASRSPTGRTTAGSMASRLGNTG